MGRAEPVQVVWALMAALANEAMMAIRSLFTVRAGLVVAAETDTDTTVDLELPD